jgi:DNA-binding GntR family transcriptional regulator
MTERRRQVAQFMREHIESGEWKRYNRIPLQNELANELHASPRVVAHATAILRQQGYL